jgi:hypothetical protein
MEGISIAGRLLKVDEISVKTEPAGVCISGNSTRDPSQWVCVYITTAALWEIINLPHVLPGSNVYPVPPFVPDEIDFSNPPAEPPRVVVPPLPPLSPLPPLPPKG